MKLNYDFLIVGSGFFGAVCARELTNSGFKCLVVDRRNHIAGNCYTDNRGSQHQVHEYGPHIFHTSNEEVWRYINQYATFNNFRLTPLANYMGRIYPLPFNMWTFNRMWGINDPEGVKIKIKSQSNHITWEPTNLEEQAIKTVGWEVYDVLIKGYTEKQWMKDPKELPASIIKRLPVRFTYDSNYFTDRYQGIPIGGYTKIFEKLLDGIEVRLGVDYLKDKAELDSMCKSVIYTGPIDEYYGYRFGELEYKTVRFEHELLDVKNHQGCAVMNYTYREVPYTRIIEHKHFEWIDGGETEDKTWVTKEYPTPYKAGVNEPYYPVNDKTNNEMYSKYAAIAAEEKNTYFGGRLAEYKYYDMDDVIESALNKVKIIINEQEENMS